MKRYLSLVLALAMMSGALTLTSCAKDPDSTTAASGAATNAPGKTTSGGSSDVETPPSTDDLFTDTDGGETITECVVGEDEVAALVGNSQNLIESYFDSYSELSITKGFEYDPDDPKHPGAKEVAPNLFDGDTETKWCCLDSEAEHMSSVVWSMTQAVTATHYSITTANDNESFAGRNPDAWRIYATNKDLDESMKMNDDLFESDEVPEGWVLITRVDSTDLPDLNYTECGYKIDNPGAYKHYMFLLDWTSLGADRFQFSELTLYGTAD